MTLTLVIGSKRWSSWSLRPWIAMKQTGIAFEEILISLCRPDTRARILRYSPVGKVPVLFEGPDPVWDSLAILDYLHRRFSAARLWPDDLRAFALAKSISAEMHSGFAALRRELPMDFGADLPLPDLSSDARSEIGRVVDLWCNARGRFGGEGPFLFGHFTNADAMYAPVVARFETYGVAVDGDARTYMQTVLAMPAMRQWRLDALARDWPET